MRCWRSYLSAARCRLSAYHPADATAIPKPNHLLPYLKSRLVLPFWYRLTHVVLEKRLLNKCYIFVNFFLYASPKMPALQQLLTKLLQFLFSTREHLCISTTMLIADTAVHAGTQWWEHGIRNCESLNSAVQLWVYYLQYNLCDEAEPRWMQIIRRLVTNTGSAGHILQQWISDQSKVHAEFCHQHSHANIS